MAIFRSRHNTQEFGNLGSLDKRHDTPSRIQVTRILCITLAITMQSCISLHYQVSEGPLRSIGMTWQQTLPAAEGFAYRIYSPGLSIRIGTQADGISIGWHELTLLFAGRHLASPSNPTAFASELYGAEIGSLFFSLGYSRTFAISNPDREGTQLIVYTPQYPEMIRILKEEAP